MLFSVYWIFSFLGLHKCSPLCICDLCFVKLFPLVVKTSK